MTRANGTRCRRATARGSEQTRARWAGSGSGRRTADPSRAGPGTGRAGIPRGAAATTARSAVPGSHNAKAPRGATALEQVAEDRREQRLVANGDRPDRGRPRRRSHSRRRRRPGRGTSQPVPALLAQESVVGRMRDAERAPDRAPSTAPRQRADARRRRPSPTSVLERRPGRRRPAASPKRPARCGRPMRLSSGIRGTIPSEAYRRVGDRLGAVRGRWPGPMPRHRAGRTRSSSARPEARALQLRAGRTASRGTTAARARRAAAKATIRSSPGRVRSRRVGDEERVGVRRLEVRVEAQQRGAFSGGTSGWPSRAG